jgi:(4S)-4-hydroxy-5-phosphonooxypentane-2,3-dione isomerase
VASRYHPGWQSLDAAPTALAGTGHTPPAEEASMLAIWVKVRVKPDQKKRFLEAIEVDALGSEKDEPGCLRFNVLQDEQDENVYYFYEVYKDAAALEAHRKAPHYQVWRAAADSLDGPTAPTRCKPVFPAARAYWGKM